MIEPAHGRVVSAGFDDAAPRWDHHYGAAGTMRLRPARFRAALARHCAPPAQVLDFGCGSGRITIALAQAGWRMTGCDISSQMLTVAKENAGDIGWVLLSPDTQRLPFAPASFDAVVASSVLEYIPDPTPTLAEFSRILRPGGWVFATVPDMRHGKRIVESAPALLAKLSIVWGIVKRTKYRDYANYLRLSVSRHGHRRWEEILHAAGLTPEPSGACSDSLLLLLARRRGG